MTRRAIALTVLLVGSILVGPISLAGGAAAAGGPPGGMVGVPDGNVGPPDHAGGGGATASPTGNGPTVSSQSSSGPPDHALENIPQNAGAWSVHADKHAKDLEVTIGADSGGLELVVSDDQNHEGREIAVDATTLEEAVGERPSTAYGLHESGDRWSSEISYEDGYATFEVPKFSSNTVEFSGEVQVNGQPAEDGSTITYELPDIDSASDPVVNATGVVSTEQESVSRSALGDGSTVDLTVAGNAQPENAEVRLSGNYAEADRSQSIALSDTVDVGGNLSPANEELTLSGSQNTQSQYSGNDAFNTVSVSYDSPPSEVVQASVVLDSDFQSDHTITVDADGTEVASDSFTAQPESETYTLSFTANPSNSITITVDSGSETIVGETSITSAYPGNVDATVDGTTTAFGTVSGSQTESIDLSPGSNTVDVSSNGVGSLSASIEYTERTATEDPSVSVAGQTVSHSGILNDSESVTESVTLPTGESQADVSMVGGEVGLAVNWTERTQTVDPAIELNGNTTNLYSGALADGETTSTTIDSSTLQSGTNRINVSVGDGSLSTDAPPPKVDLAYSHEANTSVSVDYAAETWHERYNASQTWPDDVSNAQMHLSMVSDRVIAVDELSVYDGSGTEVTYESWDYRDGTVSVTLGDLPAGTERRVVVNGTKVRVPSGEIDVVDPTIEGNELSTGIEIASTPTDGPVEIEVGGTVEGDRIHRVAESSWGADERALVTASGDQTLELPEAPAGGTATIERSPLTVTPDTGDARVSVSGTMTEPTIEVSPGESSGDTVDFTFLEASDGTRYELLSQTNNVVRDSGTANSPLTLTDDDSEETLQFYIPESSTTSDGGGGVIGPISQPQSWLEPLQLPLSLAAGVLALLLLWLAWQQGPTAAVSTVGSGATSASRGVAAGLTGAVGWLRRHPNVSAILISGLGILGVGFGLVPVPESGGTFVLIVAVPIVAYVTLIRWLEASLLTWIAVSLIASVLGLQLLGTDVLGTLVNSEAFPLVVIGALYLAYEGLQAYQAEETTPETVNRVVFDTDDSSGTGSGDSS